MIWPCDEQHCICLECFQLYGESKLNERAFVQHDEIGYTLPCPGNYFFFTTLVFNLVCTMTEVKNNNVLFIVLKCFYRNVFGYCYLEKLSIPWKNSITKFMKKMTNFYLNNMIGIIRNVSLKCARIKVKT